MTNYEFKDIHTSATCFQQNNSKLLMTCDTLVLNTVCLDSAPTAFGWVLCAVCYFFRYGVWHADEKDGRRQLS